MGLPRFARDTQNDDLLTAQTTAALGDQEGWAPGGGDDDQDAGTNLNVYDKDVERYRARGAQTQPAIKLDQAHADQAREMQMGSLGHLERQANGSAPSSAAILSQRANEGAAQSMAAAGMRRGGPGAAIAGMNAGSQAASGQALAANAQNANMRAAEVSRGQGAFAAGAAGAQGQDIQAATANAQLTAQQRALDEQRQQANERLGWDTRHAQLGNRATYDRLGQTAAQNQRNATNAEDQARYDEGMGYVNLGTSWMQGAAGGVSDARAKRDVTPMGSLSSLERR